MARRGWCLYMLSNDEIFTAMTDYLKEKRIYLEKSYFSGIIKALGMILQENYKINYSCELCSMLYHTDNTKDGHLDTRLVKKHVNAILKNLKG